MIERFIITDRAQWLAWRSQDLTASDIAAAVGLDPYKTPLKLYAEKTGQLMPDPDNASMRRGRWLEAAVLSAIREENPLWEVRPANVYLRDPQLRFGATPDALAVTDQPGLTNVQCKVVSRPVYERDWADGPPLGYVLQTLAEGMLLDAAQSLLAALVIDTYSASLELHPVPRHEAAEARVRRIVADFWANVASGRRPVADYARDAETVAALFPQSVPEPALDLSGDNRMAYLLTQRAGHKATMAIYEKEVAAIDTEIKDKLGPHEIATLPGWKISWKTQARREVIIPASTYRALRINEMAVEQEERAA